MSCKKNHICKIRLYVKKEKEIQNLQDHVKNQKEEIIGLQSKKRQWEYQTKEKDKKDKLMFEIERLKKSLHNIKLYYRKHK